MPETTSRQNVGKYGPRAIGEDAYERQQEMVEEADGEMSRFGPKALADHGAEGEAEDGGTAAVDLDTTEPSDEESASSLEQLQAALDELPLDYEAEGGKGGYYTLIGPDGEQIESSSESGRWGPGPGEARAAAQEDYEARVKQEEADETSGPDEQLSADEIRGVLSSSPEKLDQMMRVEFMRSEGPRLEVLQLLQAHESDSDQPRPEVLDTLQGAIADIQPEEGKEGS